MKAGTNLARFLLPLGFGIVVLYCGSIFVQQRQSLFAGASDFSAFYAAGRIVWSGDGNLVYSYEKQKEAQADFIKYVSYRKGPLLYNHAPFELLVFMPFALLSYSHATIVWYWLNVIGLLAVPILLRERLTFLQTEVFYALLALAFFLPANIALLQGQDSILLLLLFTLGFLQLTKGHDSAAGCILAFTTFKPQLILLVILIMMVTKRWKLVRSFLGTCLALLAVSVLLVGWHAVIEFPRFLIRFSHLPPIVAGAYPEAMPNLRGLVYALLNLNVSHVVIQVIVIGLSVLLLLLVGISCSRDTGQMSGINFSLMVVASLMVGYHLNVHDLTLLILPMFIVADYVAGHELTAIRALLGMAAGLVFIVPSLLLPPPVTVAAILLFLVALLRESLYPGTFGAVQSLPELRPNLE